MLAGDHVPGGADRQRRRGARDSAGPRAAGPRRARAPPRPAWRAAEDLDVDPVGGPQVVEVGHPAHLEVGGHVEVGYAAREVEREHGQRLGQLGAALLQPRLEVGGPGGVARARRSSRTSAAEARAAAARTSSISSSAGRSLFQRSATVGSEKCPGRRSGGTRRCRRSAPRAGTRSRPPPRRGRLAGLTPAARSSSRSGTPSRRRPPRRSPPPAPRPRRPRAGPPASGSSVPVDLDRGAVADVADPQVGQAVRREQVADRGLGPLHAGQPVRGHLDAVRDPRGEARGGGLVPRRQPPPVRGLADLRLGEPGVAQGCDGAALVGGADARAGSRPPRRRRSCRSRRSRCRAPRRAG